MDVEFNTTAVPVEDLFITSIRDLMCKLKAEVVMVDPGKHMAIIGMSSIIIMG